MCWFCHVAKIIRRIWDDIRNGENIDLYLTVAVVFIIGALNIFGSAPQEWVTSATLAALGILAISALRNEHHSRELSQKLAKSIGGCLRSRSQFIPLDEYTKTASEIVIVTVSAVSLFNPYFGVFERKLKEGCKLSVLVLDPDSPAVQTWNLGVRGSTTEADIKNTLAQLRELMKAEKRKGQCQVRLSSVYPPFSMSVVDPKKNTGSMVVELHAFKTPLTERPHISVSRLEDQRWFDFFMEQFEKIWADSMQWNP